MIDRTKSASHIIRDNGLPKQLAPVITARIRAIRITEMLQGTGARMLEESLIGILVGALHNSDSSHF